MDMHWTIYLQRDGTDEKVPLAMFQRSLEGATVARLPLKFLMQDCARHRSESVADNFGTGAVAESPQRGIDRGVTHEAAPISRAWEHVWVVAG